MEKIGQLFLFSKYIIFGATNSALNTIKVLNKYGKNVSYILDNDKNKTGYKFYSKYEIMSPECLKNIFDKHTAIIVSSAYQSEIFRQLVNDYNIPIENIFPYIDDLMYSLYKDAKLFSFDLSVLNNFEDDNSKEYLKSLIIFRKSLNILDIKPFKNIKEQYIHPAIDYLKIKGAVLDIGAYDGDSMKIFLKYCKNTSKIFCIEPQENNYNLLKKNIDMLHTDKIVAIQYAIADKDNIKVCLDDEDSISSTSKISQSGDNNGKYILTKTLDTLYASTKIDLIKMDIEGFEKEALAGAKYLIKKQMPTLIISAYHKNKDIYDLIQLILSTSTSYKLYAYHHPVSCYEVEYYFVNQKHLKEQKNVCR